MDPRILVPGLRCLTAGLLLSVPTLGWAVGTAANTPISNTATATYTDPSSQVQSAISNTVTILVDELLDVTIANGGNLPVFTPATNRALAFTVTNTGNGTEAFELYFAGVGGDDFDPDAAGNNPRIFIETDGTPGFSGGDTLYVFGTNEPVLGPDAQRVVYFVSDIPAGLANGDSGTVSLRATAVTCDPNGNPAGTTFAGQGDDDGNPLTPPINAVAGSTTCSAIDQASYLVSSVTSTLDKTQSVADPFGGTTAIPGSVITYTLVFTLSGTGSITLGRIVDAIPANTTYVPNSITLNAVAQTDADDPPTDGSRFTGTGIEVNLASPLAAPSTQTVTFQVRIN